VVLTVAAAAAIVGTRTQIPTSLLASLFVAAGIFHGYAYGESIVGAEPAPLAAYVIGLGVIQYGIAVGSGAALYGIIGRNYMSETMALRLAAGGIALAAILAFIAVAPLG
jgi:urease accessory protein